MNLILLSACLKKQNKSFNNFKILSLLEELNVKENKRSGKKR